jgi:hypothetical protein
MSLEKKAKEKRAETEAIETQIHEDALPCIFRVSFPFRPTLS